MNKILTEIKQIMNENMKKYLPEVKDSDLEENGQIYYMNGRNGTEFDWYVNDKISDFMMFYNDESLLGVMKLTLYNDGGVLIYIYGDHGHKMIKEVKSWCKASKKEIMKLAIILKNEADEKRIFDAGIDKIMTDRRINRKEENDFKNNKKYYEASINRKKLLNLYAYVSKKITEEGWKVGYMFRNEPAHERDSGWQFLAGNEDDQYLNSPKNIELLSLGHLCQLDFDILKYIDKPVGTQMIRISSNEFVVDDYKKEIYVEKR